ncbi:MAG TPA: DUF5916 domain-containing protein [Longimicrobiaceae bacterium]|nr:DUF5916 domain-containing protein [Longimicrobiaceae bacterium]
MKRSLLLLSLLLAPQALQAQSTASPEAVPLPPTGGAAQAVTVRATEPLRVDGRLDEAIWATAPAISGFTQRDPAEGQPVSEATEVRIVYDDEALYVGARLHDRRPVARRLGRRDMEISASDWLRISLDSYRDRRTAYRFDVNPAGVRRDAFFTAESYESPWSEQAALSWDAVWEAATAVDEGGWTVEIRIPFSQLRFSPAEEQSWGIQIERIIDREQETAVFAFTPKAERGGIAAFGELSGLRGIRPGRRLEVLPYLVSRGEFVPPGTNPYQRAEEFALSGGLDAKYRLASNLTLSATLNPDFGQVEVDPAVINLTAFETRLEEKRPFFVEGAGSFDFAGAAQGSPASEPANLFYSRRIGRTPQIGVPSRAADLPEATRILGAAKLSGKPAAGWSVGVLDALTAAEYGRYRDAEGADRETLVEPRTNYFVGRVNRELREGQTAIGGILTAVNRDLASEAAIASLRSAAYVGGIDFQHEWASRGWMLSGYFAASEVFGREQAITRTQRSPTRYFQRPDADHLQIDPDATSLGGYAAQLQLEKRAGKHITGDLVLWAVSPGYETNDLGLLFGADRVRGLAALEYAQRQPGRVLRSWRARMHSVLGQNYGGDRVEEVVGMWTQLQHLSYWSLVLWGDYSSETMNDRFTRGGPLVRLPARWTGSVGIGSDPRKPVLVRASVLSAGDRAGERSLEGSLSLGVRPSPRWSLSAGPRLRRVEAPAQYVTAVPDPEMAATYGRRYVFAPLDLTELSLQTRLNLTFTPDLSLELYAQPLLSHGSFGTPRELAAPRTFEFHEYGAQTGTLTRLEDGYEIDPDGAGPAEVFRVPDRSFDTRSLRGNAVLRWEYRPGSTLFLVWQQRRWNDDLTNSFHVGRAADALWSARPENVLVLKWTYWFNPGL